MVIAGLLPVMAGGAWVANVDAKAAGNESAIVMNTEKIVQVQISLEELVSGLAEDRQERGRKSEVAEGKRQAKQELMARLCVQEPFRVANEIECAMNAIEQRD